jgi:predicted phosphodiesterase
MRNSPFSEQTLGKFSNMNQSAINDLHNRDQGVHDIIVNVLSDSHQNYDDLDEAISCINNSPADFLTHLGDFTNQGYNIEYDMFVSRMKNLNLPHIQIMGNHDTLAKGKALFNRIFGYYNQSFDYGGYRFIIFNNNKLDYYYHNGVDWNWLKQKVTSTTLPIVLMNHINTENHDYFTAEDLQKYHAIVDGSNVRLVLHGHQHEFYTQEINGVLNHQTARTEGALWSRVTLSANFITIENCTKNVCKFNLTKNFP